MAFCNCFYCGKEFKIKPYRLKNNTRKFCSKECLSKWKSEFYKGKNNPSYNSKMVNCDFCGKQLEKPNNIIERNKHNFCDNTCKIGWQKKSQQKENNFNYKGGNIECVCECCSKTYDVVPSRKNKTRFCSKECQLQFLNQNKHSIKVSCDYCGKEIIKFPSKIHEHNFCNLQCLGKWNGERTSQKVKKYCTICGKEYLTSHPLAEKSVVCSRKCHNIWYSEIYSKTPEAIEKKLKWLSNMKNTDTKPEVMVKEYLLKNKINFIHQYPILNYIADFYLPDTNLIIEVFGDYWHSNPLFYGNNKKPLGKIQLKIKNRDKKKIYDYKGNNINYIILWENDIYNNVENLLNDLRLKNPPLF